MGRIAAELEKTLGSKVLIQCSLAHVSRMCAVMVLGCNLGGGSALAEADRGNVAPPYAPDFDRGVVQAINLAECKVTPGMLYSAGDNLSASCGNWDISLSAISMPRKVREDDGEVATHIAVRIQEKGKAAIQAMMKMAEFPGGEFVDFVRYADLNGDAKPDFMIETGSHGNGLAAEFGGRLFLLSDGRGYRYLGLGAVMTASRLVRFTNQSSATLILQRMAEPAGPDGSTLVPSLDRKEHNYFVLDLVQFDSASPKGAKLHNALDARFPFWTQYTNKPQKWETKLLSPARKKALWHDPLARAVSGMLTSR